MPVTVACTRVYSSRAKRVKSGRGTAEPWIEGWWSSGITHVGGGNLSQAVLLVEQHTERALGIADRGYVMRRGELAAAGTPAQLRDELDSLYNAYPVVP